MLKKITLMLSITGKKLVYLGNKFSSKMALIAGFIGKKSVYLGNKFSSKMILIADFIGKKLPYLSNKFSSKTILKMTIASIVIIVLIVVLVIAHVIRGVSTKHIADIPATIVETSTVTQRTIPVIVAVSGSLVAVQHVDISPEIEGQIAGIEFTDGQHVTAGSVLYQLDDSISRAKLAQFRAKLKFSQKDFRRNYKLLQTDAFSPKELDVTKESLEESQALVEQYRLTVRKMQIVAPFNGTIGTSKVSIGQHVAAGNTLVTLVDTDNLQATYHVSENYLTQLKLGQLVVITSDILPGKQFLGTVNYIAPSIDEGTRTIEVHAKVSNKTKKLAPGMFVKVVQALGKRQNALMIPVQALQRSISGYEVYIVKQNHAIETPVKIGLRIGDKVEITRGLVAEDVVIIAGQQKIHDGSLVKIFNEKKKAVV